METPSPEIVISVKAPLGVAPKFTFEISETVMQLRSPSPVHKIGHLHLHPRRTQQHCKKAITLLFRRTKAQFGEHTEAQRTDAHRAEATHQCYCPEQQHRRKKDFAWCPPPLCCVRGNGRSLFPQWLSSWQRQSLPRFHSSPERSQVSQHLPSRTMFPALLSTTLGDTTP